MFTSPNPALLIIDVQQAIDHFSDLPRSNPNAELNMQLLLARWRQHNWLRIHICHASKFSHSPYHPDSGSYAFKQEVMPEEGEDIVTKQENCAFIATDLDHRLKQADITELVICGVLTNNSVDATVRVAAALGYRVYLVDDATAAGAIVLADGNVIAADLVQDIFLANLKGEYADIVSTRTLETLAFDA